MQKLAHPTVDQKVELLGHVPLFSGLSAEQRRHLVDRAKTRVFPGRTVVVHEGDAADTLFVVATGSVKIFLAGSGGEEVSLAVLGTASVCGEMAVLDQRPRSASVMTLEPTVLLEIGRPAIETAVAASPGLAMMMMKHLASMLRRADAQIRTLSLPSAEVRVLRALITLAAEQGHANSGDLLVSPKPTNLQIAERVACRPETVSRVMKGLREGGLIADAGPSVRVRPRALENYEDSFSDLF